MQVEGIHGCEIHFFQNLLIEPDNVLIGIALHQHSITSQHRKYGDVRGDSWLIRHVIFRSKSNFKTVDGVVIFKIRNELDDNFRIA